MKIVPFRGKFDTKSGLLGALLEDDTVEQLVVVSLHKDGMYHIQSTRDIMTSHLSFAADIIRYEVYEKFRQEDSQ